MIYPTDNWCIPLILCLNEKALDQMLSAAGCFKPSQGVSILASNRIFAQNDVPRKHHVLRNDGIYMNIYEYTVYEYIYMLLGIRSCHCNILQQGHLNQSCLRLEKFFAFVICFPEILRRKQEIWDLGTGAISTRKVHWWGGKLMDNSHISDLGMPWAWRSSRFILVIKIIILEIFGGILGFAAVSTRIIQNPQSSHSQTRTPVSLSSLRTAPREKNTAVPPRVRRCISAVRSEEAQLCLACCWAIGDHWRAEITEISGGKSCTAQNGDATSKTVPHVLCVATGTFGF